MRLRLPLALLALLGPACTLPLDPLGPDTLTLRGHYNFGFEASAFTACGSTERWWTSGDMQAVRSFIDSSAEYAPRPNDYPVRSGRVFVHGRGERSPKGRYGHLGAFPREFKVLYVLEVRASTETDCA